MTFSLLLAVGPLGAQDSKPAPGKAQPAAGTKVSALSKVIAAAEADRPAALLSFIEGKIATRAVYAGQYSGLAKVLWDVKSTLREWVTEAPLDASNVDAVRNASLSALRDLHGNKAPEAVMQSLKKIAADPIESGAMRNAAAFAMAQFGDRSLVDGHLQRATKMTEAEKPEQRAQGWSMLAQINYNIRNYAKAAAAYVKLVGMIDASEVRMRPDALPTTLYNTACNLALAGKKDEAFGMLEKALATAAKTPGSLPDSLLSTDMDIRTLRQDKRFAAMLAKYRGKKAPVASKPVSQGTPQPKSRPSVDK